MARQELRLGIQPLGPEQDGGALRYAPVRQVVASANSNFIELYGASAGILGVGTGLAYSTIGAALAAATAGQTVRPVPGTYTEDLVVPEGVKLDAWDSVLVGTIEMASDTAVRLHRHFAAANNDVLVLKSGGSGHGFYSANVQDGRGTGGALTGCIGIRNVSNGSVLFANVGVMFVATNGTGVTDGIAGFGHCHFWTPDLYLSTGSIGINATQPNTDYIGYIDHILQLSGATGTTGIRISNANAIVKATITELRADTAYNIVNGSLHLVCSRIVGTRTGTPVFEVSDQSPRLVPAGGTTGQVLTKLSNADYHVGWA